MTEEEIKMIENRIRAAAEEQLSQKYTPREILDMKLALLQQDIKKLAEDLEQLESDRIWVIRIVISAIIVAVLGLVVTGKQAV